MGQLEPDSFQNWRDVARWLQLHVAFGFGSASLLIALVNYVQNIVAEGLQPVEAFLGSDVSLVAGVAVLTAITGVKDSVTLRRIQVGAFLLVGLIAAADASPGNLTSALFLLVGVGLYWAYGYSQKYLSWKLTPLLLAYVSLLTWSFSRNGDAPVFHTINNLILIAVFGYIAHLIWKLFQLRERRYQQVLEQQVDERTKELSEALHDRGVLVKEIHHRVKNNLQLISSFLSLATNASTSNDVRTVLTESTTRVKAIALVHERLYQSDAYAAVGLNGYLQELGRELRQVLSTDIRMSTELPDSLSVSIDVAVPFGLTLNELISNVIEHGQPTSGSAKQIGVDVGLIEDRISADVYVSGQGLPENIHGEDSQSLGLSIVHSLIDQLRGTIELHTSEDGTRWHIEFPRAHSGIGV